MFWLLEYDLADDYLERRGRLRAVHLALARDARDAGDLVLAGALSNPADRALLVFQGADGSAAERFAESDPYVTEGLVTAWRVRPWTVVIGTDLAAIEPPSV
ncbi:MAG: hypothetical protein JWN67_3360 [Actinomycetia bacterium]|nr:hypothetical protein [Actinomycetes bacterium]